jgi:hypothetical protein
VIDVDRNEELPHANNPWQCNDEYHYLGRRRPASGPSSGEPSTGLPSDRP